MDSPQKVKVPRVLFRRVFPVIGTVGLAITIAMNLVALLVLKKAAAEFFSHAWWFAWFPSYLVWLSFLLTGLAGLLMKQGPNPRPAPEPRTGP